MIITRTPLRISLVGGGTDMPTFWKRTPGAVISFAIDQYVYVILNDKFEDGVRVSYSRTENVAHVMDLKHDIIREGLLSYGVGRAEVATVADIPGEGSGLGSSSALAVGLVRALYKMMGMNSNLHPAEYAEDAYRIERSLCLHPVGKQDHYASAYGGLHFYQFNPDGSVLAEMIHADADRLREFENHFTLLWTGRNRQANDILRVQEKNLDSGAVTTAVEMRDLAFRLRDELRGGDFSNVGAYLHENWVRKKELAYGISNPWINELYEKAIFAGAQGGKVCGAGGGGFLLFYGPLGIGPELEKATGLKRVPFGIEEEGSKVIYEDSRR